MINHETHYEKRDAVARSGPGFDGWNPEDAEGRNQKIGWLMMSHDEKM